MDTAIARIICVSDIPCTHVACHDYVTVCARMHTCVTMCSNGTHTIRYTVGVGVLTAVYMMFWQVRVYANMWSSVACSLLRSR
jgi:hypothetical protein